MSNGPSSLPPINPGDPSDVTKPTSTNSFANIDAKYNLTSNKLPEGVVRLARAPGQQFSDVPFNPILDTPKTIGSKPWYMVGTPDTSQSIGVATGIATGLNVADPRVTGQSAEDLYRESRKFWESTGDRWVSGVFGGMAIGLNRLGQDFGSLLGGSFWGEDFEKNAIERYFADQAATTQAQVEIFNDSGLGLFGDASDGRFFQGLQSGLASGVEFAPIGGAVAKGAKVVKKGIVKGRKLLRQADNAADIAKKRKIVQSPFGSSNVTRVSDQVAENGTKLGNFFRKNQNVLAQAGEAIPAGILQNRFEGTAMAVQTYEEVMNDLSAAIDAGDLTYEQAQKIAAQEASGVRTANMAMMVQDIFQHALLFRARGATRTGYQRPGFTWNPRKYLRSAFEDSKSIRNYAVNNFIVQGVGEALEEGFQSGLQNSAIRSARDSARDLIKETGGDLSNVAPEFGSRIGRSALQRYMDHMTTDDARFEMAVGFFAGAGQRMVQSYTRQAADTRAYNKYTKQIEALKKELPTDTVQNRARREKKIAELEYKRALETEKGRAEAAKNLLDTLKTGVKDAVLFSLETDELITDLTEQNLSELAKGIQDKAFYQLFMKHAANGTVDHLERHLQDVAEGRSTSDMFPADGAAQTRAKELLGELNRLEQDYLSLQGFTGAHRIMATQETARINQRVVDANVKNRDSRKQEVIEDLRKLSKSKATNIELDLETGEITMKDSLDRNIPLSKSMKAAVESSESYQEIFKDGGLNDQINVLQDAVVEERASLSEMISKPGQARLRREEEELQREIAERQKQIKNERKASRTKKKGKKRSDRDRANLDNNDSRARSSSAKVEGDNIAGATTLTPEAQTDSTEREPTIGQDLADLGFTTEQPTSDNSQNGDIKSDKDLQDEADRNHQPNESDTVVFGYERGERSSQNKVANLQLEYETGVNGGVVTLEDTDLNQNDAYLSLSDAEATKPGDKLEFRVVPDSETDERLVRDVSDDPDGSKQGTVKTVKSARQRKKELAEHETAISGETITEEQIIEDTQPIEIIAVRKDSNGNEVRVVVGYVHTPLFEREARREISAERIANHKKAIREFRKKILAGQIRGGTISEVNTVRLNYIPSGKRQVTEAAFEGAELGKDYWVTVSNNGKLTLPGGSSIYSSNGIGRNRILNEDKLVDGVAYVVVPLTANKDGSINYYAAPLLTGTVTPNNAEVMMAAVQAFTEGGDAAKAIGASLGITLNQSGLKMVLKRFIRVRGTHNMPHKSGQSFVYEKTVEKNGKTEKRLVVRKVLDSQSEAAFTEVEIIPGQPLGEDAAFVKAVLAEQISNVDLDAVKADNAFISVMDTATGGITTRKISGAEYISKYTLASIAPVRTKDGKIPNGRVVYHLNPDVRFVTGVEGVDPAMSEESAMRPDDAPEGAPGLNPEEVANAAEAYSKPESEVTQQEIDDLNEADDLLDGLGFDFGEETKGLLPQSSTNRSQETRERFSLEGLLPTQQEELINNFVGNILTALTLKTNIREQADKETLFNEALEETLADTYKKLESKVALLNKVAGKTGQDKYKKAAERAQSILDNIKKQEAKMVSLALANLEQQAGVRKKKRRKEVERPQEEGRKSAVQASLDRVRKFTQALLDIQTDEKGPGEMSEENESDTNEESAESSPGINKSYHSDGFYFTLDPIDTASSRLRQSLMTLPEVGPQGKVKKNFIGETVYGDPYQVFKLLSTALSGTSPIFSKQMETLLRKYVQDRGFRNSAPWLPALALNSATVESLVGNEVGKAFIETAFPDASTRQADIQALSDLKLDPQILNEFASVMSKHTLVAPMVSITTTSEGNTYVNVFSQNRNSADSVVREEFDRGMRNRLYIKDNETGDYIVNEEAFLEALSFLEELQSVGGEISSSELVRRMSSSLGITISEDTANALIQDGIRLSTNKRASRVRLSDPSMFTSNNSPFVQLRQHLQDILDNKTPYSVKRASSFGGFGKLTRIEASRSSNRRHGSTFYAGGRNLATMTSNKYFSSMLDELFTIARDNESPLEAVDVVYRQHPIFSTVFESSSQMLNAILQGDITKEDLEVQYLNFTPLKQDGIASGDFNKLQEAQHIVVKNGLFTSSTNTKGTFTTDSGKVFEQRRATIVPLTYSDKDTVMALKTLVPIMKFDSVGQLDADTIDLFYDHVLLSEMNRIKMFSDNNADSSEGQDASESGVNNEELEMGSSLFYLLPQFNSMEVQFREETVLLTDALRSNPTNEELADLKKSLLPALRTVLDEMVDDKLQEFQENPELYGQISTNYKEMIAAGKTPAVAMRMVAADITLGQTLGTANVIQSFVGDPALYAKIKTDQEGNVLPDATVKATYANIDKRLASLIAPGMDPSRKDDNEEYIQIMVPDIEMDYDSKFFDGLPDELVEKIFKSYQGVEATDAQEFITWEEYLENAVSFGEISEATADKVATLIRKYERGYVLKPDDKELLKSVMFKAQKPVGVVDHYTNLKGSNSQVRQRLYVKTSAVPLLPMFTKGTQLDNLRKAMERLQKEQGKGVRLTFKTGIKVGFPAASKNAKLTNNDGTIKSEEELYEMFSTGDDNGLPYVVAKRKYWRIQQSVPTKKKDESTRATQPDALIGSAAASIPEIQPLADAFTENSNKLFRLRADKLREELMVDSTDPNIPGKVIDREKLGIMLEEVAKDRGFDFNTIEGLTIGEDGQFEIPAELSPASEQFQSMLLSIARKGIARKKVTGGSQVLMTEAMFRAQPGATDAQSDILYTSAYDPEEGLKPMRIEDGVVKPAQIVLPNKMRLPDGKLINFREYVGEDGRIDLNQLPEGALEAFAYRIPTAGYNFMAAVEVVGFMPDYMGDIVIAPRSFMIQMGSDFDVDKLYDYFFKMEKKNGRLQKIQDETELGLQNALLQNRLDIMKNKSVFALVKAPTDFGLNKFDDGRYTNEADSAMQSEINAAGGMADAIANKKERVSRSKGSILSEFYQKGKYLEARAALDAVGVKATLNSFFGVLGSTSAPIVLSDAFTFGNSINIKIVEGTKTLKNTGRLKQDVSASSLNSAVDNQNEQIVNKVNLNDVTFDAHDAMELLGFEEDFALTFLEQPAIKLLVKRVQADPFKTVKSAINDLQSGIILEIAKQQGMSSVNSEEAKKIFTKAINDFEERFSDRNYDQIVSDLWKNVGKDVGAGVMEDLSFSLAILNKFAQLSGIMSDLRPAIRLLSADSKGAGSTVTDFVTVAERADELLEDDYVTSDSMLGLLGQYVIENTSAGVVQLEKEGYVKGPYVAKGSKVGYLMVKPSSAKSAASLHTLSVSQDLMDSEFKGVFTLIRDISKRAYIKDTNDTKNVIQKGIRQYINSDSRLYSGVTLYSLMYPNGDNPSLAQLVEAAKLSPQLRRNALIQELETDISQGEAHTLSYRNSASDDLVTDKIAKAFLDLLIGPKSNEVIEGLGITPNQLGRMLIDYSFLTGGIKTAVDFSRFAPTSYLIDVGFFKNLKVAFNDLRTSASTRNDFVEQLIQNNPDIVARKASISSSDGVVLDKKSSNISEGIAVFKLSSNYKERIGLTFDPDTASYAILPAYNYITIKPKNKPRRVLKFNSRTGNYEMLDNLGTNTISEFAFNDNQGTILEENRVKNYLGRRDEEVEEAEETPELEAGDTTAPVETTTEEDAQGTVTKQRTPSNLEALGFSSTAVEGQAPVDTSTPELNAPAEDPGAGTAEETQPELTDEQKTTFEKLGFVFGDPQPDVTAASTEVSGTALTSMRESLQNKSTVSVGGAQLTEILEEVRQSDDMAHKYLANEILDSGILEQKKIQVIFKRGSTLDSTATGRDVIIGIDEKTDNWDFEQALLHEIGHGLTMREIVQFERNSKSQDPKVRKALARLEGVRQQFLQNLQTLDSNQIAAFIAYMEGGTAEGDSAAVEAKFTELISKIETARAKGDVKGVQDLINRFYGATDLGEFVTLVMSNEAFRQELDEVFTIDTKGRKTDVSFLKAVMELMLDIFTGVLNLDKRPISQYALEQAMFVAKQDLPDIDLSDRPMVEEQPMIVNNRGYKIDGNDNVVAEDGKPVSKGQALRVRANYAARDNRLGKVRLDNDVNTYMVFDTQDGIMVIKKSPKGAISEVTPRNKKYAEIIESGFQGGDNNLGGTTVTPASAAQQPRVAQSSPKRSVIEDTKFTYKGLNGESVTVDTDFRLTEGQGAALESLIDFVANPKPSQNFEDLSMTLEGPAGTGKTTVIGLVKKVVDELNLGFLKQPTFIYAAPTHAATVELTSATVKLGEQIPAATIQSLGSMEIDRQNPSKGPKATPRKKLGERSGVANIIVLDEASMLSKSDYQFLKELSQDSSKRDTAYRVIFMGDPQQIPEVIPGSPKTKKVSAAFTDSPKVTLTEVKRTSDNDILEVLEEMRANITGRVPVKEGASNIKYRRKADGLKEYIAKIKESGEGTVYIGYTNRSVSETNKFVRESLGYEGGLKPGEVLTGYLGYQSKQVTASATAPPGLANSVRYTVESTEIDSGNGLYLVKIRSRSEKLAALAEAGVKGMPGNGRIATTYVPLSESDSIALESEPTKEQYEKNNEHIAYHLRKLYQAKQKALSDGRYWRDFFSQKQITSKFFATVDLGDNYVYNPTTDRMEVFDSKKPAHRKAKPDFYVEKGIDYGYAITIHKAQGSTINNVFFDANTLPAKGPTIVDKQGNRITEEAHALAYVGISRSAKTLTVMGDRADRFYVLGKDEAPVIGYDKPVRPTTPPQTQESKPMDGPLGDLGFTKGLVPLAGTVEDFLKKLDPNEVKAFREMSQNGELKTICKL